MKEVKEERDENGFIVLKEAGLKTYRVSITETHTDEVEIEATSEDEAKSKASDNYDHGEYVLGYECLQNVEFEVVN